MVQSLPRIATVIGLLLAGSSHARAAADPAEAYAVTVVVDQETDVESQTKARLLADRLGPWAYVVAPLFMIVVAILPIPAEIPALLNGIVFNMFLGTFITWGGALVGAVMSFEIARRCGRPFCERLARPTLIMRADRLVASAGWPGLIFLRLVPAVAFTAINWASGLTSMSRWTFLWTTAVGILPGAILFTMSGRGVAAVYQMSPAAAAGILVLAVLVGWWTVARYRRRPLRRWTGEFGATAL
jgi:uncharacterized membrane protein YdjX (TVP38/TMEM64 family)